MAKIAIAQVPQLRSASFQQTASTNLLSAEGAAFQRLGGAIFQSSEVIGAYQEKKQKLRADSVMAQAQVEQANAQADVETYAMNHPDQPEAWAEYRETRFGEIEGRLNYEGLDAENITSVQNYLQIGNTRSDTQLRTQAEKRRIENDNAVIRQAGDMLLRQGKRDEAIAEYGKMTMPNADKIELIENALTEGLYSDIKQEISMATIDEAEAIWNDLRERDESGDYVNYEFDMGGLRKKQRADLENYAYAQVQNRRLAAAREVTRQQDAIVKGESWTTTEDMTEGQVVALERLSESYSDGFSENSPEYQSLLDDIDTAKMDFLGFEKDPDWFEDTWRKINGGYYNEEDEWVEEGDQFNRTARNQLIRAMLEAEARNIADSEEDVEGKFFSRILSDSEKLVRTTLGERITRSLAAMQKDPLLTELSPESYGRVYQDILRQVRADADGGRIKPENVRQYIEQDLSALMEEQIQPLDSQLLRDQMRGAGSASMAVGAATAGLSEQPQFQSGQRVVQDGVTYEFDGTNWNPIN